MSREPLVLIIIGGLFGIPYFDVSHDYILSHNFCAFSLKSLSLRLLP